LNKVKPGKGSRAANLLANNDPRARLSDEPEELGPEVALVGSPTLGTGDAEGLAGARSGPDWAVVWPAGAPEGVGPDCNSAEHVDLSKPSKVIWLDFRDASFIDHSRGN
jgi:hypothetical protein